MNKVIVSGSSGYIGAHLVHQLLERGYLVTGIDKYPFPQDGQLKNFHELIIDLECESSWLSFESELVSQTSDHTAIFHLASSSDMSASFSDPEKYIEMELLKAKRLTSLLTESDVKKVFVFSSSCSVYGNTLDEPAKENSPLHPISPYANAKAQVEEFLMDQAKTQNYSSISFRFFNVVGRDHAKGLAETHSPETHILPQLLRATKENSTFTVFGTDFETADGSALRDYIDVRDVARGLILGLEKRLTFGNENLLIWNLGSEKPLTVLELIQKVEAVTGTRIQKKFSGRRLGDPAKAVADSSKVHRDLNWYPEYSIEDSILSLLV
jgi:UDP-glucose 4-epimerase